jgi:hypothetical protein
MPIVANPTSIVALVPLPNLAFDALATSGATTEVAVAAGVELFWQDFLTRQYGAAVFRGTDLETTISAAGGTGTPDSGRINVSTTGTAVFNGPPSTDSNVRTDVADYLANGGGAMALANFLSNANVTDIGTIALDGEVVVAAVAAPGGEPSGNGTSSPTVTPMPVAPPAASTGGGDGSVPFPVITFDAAAFNATEAAVARVVDQFLQDFLKREYPEEYQGTDVATTISAAGEGRINVKATGYAIFNGPAAGADRTTALRDDLADYLANGGDLVLADFISSSGISDINNLALDGKVVVPAVSSGGGGTEKNDQSAKNNTSAIVAGVVGGLAVCLLCALVGSCFARRNRREEEDDPIPEVEEKEE